MKKSAWILWGVLLAAAIAAVCFTAGKGKQAYDKLEESQRALEKTEQTANQQKEGLKDKMEELESLKAAKEKAAREEQEEKSAIEGKEGTGSPEEAGTGQETETNQAAGTQQDTGIQEGGQKETASNGRVVGLDPGHQGPSVDMSGLEPNGPGSSVMKAKATSGTTGTYSGLGEYQLNLDVSLKLKDVLEDRGYQVVMTRNDNETAISNAERALLAAEQGADIYVRIHANGDDTHTVSGALAMAPSPENPHVASLYGESQRLSQCILDAYCQATGFENRGLLYQDDMTGINWSKVPVTILEMGFMTSQQDDLKMADSGFQNTMAEGIADGIDRFFDEGH